jgi:cysteine-rich repeat protein
MRRSLRLFAFVGCLLGASSAFAFGIQGRVYCDTNGDGMIDAGDTPLAGITVRVALGGDVRTAVTDATGLYVANLLMPGTWHISVDPASLNPGATATELDVALSQAAPFAVGADLLVDDPACRAPYCGDGVVDPNEACDDGNNVDGDGCSAVCAVEPYCGDGVLDPGEQCDDGNKVSGDGCSEFCALERGGEGCTPGYWKQRQHFDSYPNPPYAPTTLFVDAFGIDAFPGKTLVQVLSLKGGDLNALGRHAAAALLNGASDDVDYDRSAAEVIASFAEAYASGEYEFLKNLLEGFNEQGCPLN